MTRFAELLGALATGGADFILAGGVAAAALGSARSTLNLDLVYRRPDDNLRAIAASLAPHHPYLRGAPPGLPFQLDFDTLRAGLNFTLVTDLGWVDLLGEVAGGGRYEDILPHSLELQMFGFACRLVGLEMLIHMKRAAGRPKDLEILAELELLLERRRPRR